MACENIIITIEETNEIVEIIVNDFTVSNVLSNDVGNSAILGTDGGVYVPHQSGGVENHSELNLDDGTNPHGTTKVDVGLGNVNNTSDLDKPISNATQTALNSKLSNDPTTYIPATLPLTGTEVALLNDGTNWVKITWNNIKAQLANVYQAILVSGTNIKTINGTSILGSGNLVVSGGGGDEFLLDGLTFPAQRYNTINVWRSPFPSYQAVDSNSLASYGTGTTPNASFNTYAFWLSVPDGYIIDKIELNINYKLEGSINSTLQVYVLKSEVNYSYIGTSVFNEQVLANESVVLSAGSQTLKYCKNLTVASNSLPALNKMHLRFAVRETQATDVYYSLNFKVKFKKA